MDTESISARSPRIPKFFNCAATAVATGATFTTRRTGRSDRITPCNHADSTALNSRPARIASTARLLRNPSRPNGSAAIVSSSALVASRHSFACLGCAGVGRAGGDCAGCGAGCAGSWVVCATTILLVGFVCMVLVISRGHFCPVEREDTFVLSGAFA